MIVVKNPRYLQRLCIQTKRKGKKIAFVPTMGALHAGHLKLIKQARKAGDFVVVSIFVNPQQFAPGEDYKRYPRTFNTDKQKLKKIKIDCLFHPHPGDMYPATFSTYIDEYELSSHLCGRFREGHFRGVCTIVAKLFNIVQPDLAYFGQKDYQQAQIIKRMAKDLNFPTKVKTVKTVRERDGLAISSRNQYLTKQQRYEARFIYDALKKGKVAVLRGERRTSIIKNVVKDNLKRNISQYRIQYLSIVDPNTLKEVKQIKTKAVIALAIYLGGCRLIDNIVVKTRKKDGRKN
jgi:pantoate--beta-alanine ligase